MRMFYIILTLIIVMIMLPLALLSFAFGLLWHVIHGAFLNGFYSFNDLAAKLKSKL